MKVVWVAEVTLASKLSDPDSPCVLTADYMGALTPVLQGLATRPLGEFSQ